MRAKNFISITSKGIMITGENSSPHARMEGSFSMKRLLACALFTFWGSGLLLYSADDPLHRESVGESIKACYQLDHAKAFEIANRIQKEDPDSPVGYGMVALISWNEVLFKARNLALFQYGVPTYFDGIKLTEEMLPEEHRQFLDANKALQDFCNQRIKKNPRDVLANYFKGVSYETLSMQALMLYKKKVQAGNLAKEAGKAHEDTLVLEPGFVDAKTSMAVVEYAVGSLNFWQKLAVRLVFWLPSDKEGAMQRLQEVADKGIYRATDALLVMGYLEAWKGDPDKAIAAFSRLREMYPRNFLLDLCVADAYENAAKDPKSAIGIYQDLLRNLPDKAPGIHPAEIHFRIGKNYAKLKDYSLALEQFRKALDTDNGDRETKPLAYYNMALIHEDRGEKAEARESYREMLALAGSNELIEAEIKRAKKKIR